MNNYEIVLLHTLSGETIMRRNLLALPLLIVAASPGAALAHFQELIPSTDIIAAEGDRAVTLDLTFTHPMEGGPVMEMAPPVRFGVMTGGKKTDLKAALTPAPKQGKSAFSAKYAFKEPGAYVFFLEPQPYWEPAEKKFIVHYTKVVTDFAGGEEWDAPVGFPLEIQPLARPYGLWTGNLFRGIVKRDGKPLPFAEIEVEWRNDGTVKAPSDPFVTQVIKADDRGVFAYAMPRAGWWAFNAVAESDKTLKAPDGKPGKIEMGGTIWVKTTDMK